MAVRKPRKIARDQSTPRPSAAREPWRLGVAAAALSGLLVAAAYPGIGLWALAWAAHAPLLVYLYLRRPSWQRALWLGVIDGLVLHAVVYHWIADTLRDMSGAPMPLAWAGVVAHGALMGLHQGLWAAAVVTFDRLPAVEASGVRRALVAGSVYAAVEFIVPFQFPWYLGNALYAAPMWLQPADIVGIEGLSGLCVWSAALLAAAVVAGGRRERLVHAALIGLTLLAWRGYGELRSWQREQLPVEQTPTFAIIQPNPSLAEKRALRPAQRLPMLDRAFRLTRELDLKGVDVVLWPEGSLPFFHVPLPGEPEAQGLSAQQMRAPPVLLRSVERVYAFARTLGRPWVTGTLRRTDPRWRERARNAAMLLWPDGRKAFYDKQLLVPFGEYLPGRGLFPSLAEAIPGISDMEAGQGSAQYEIAGIKVAMTICYEALFAAHVWHKAATADVLFNLTDDVWFGPTNAPELHLMVQIARAVEMRRPLVRAAATGVSAVVDDMGRIQARTPVFREATLVQSVQVRAMQSPYRWWGPWPMRAWTATLLGALVALWWRRRAAQALVPASGL